MSKRKGRARRRSDEESDPRSTSGGEAEAQEPSAERSAQAEVASTGTTGTTKTTGSAGAPASSSRAPEARPTVTRASAIRAGAPPKRRRRQADAYTVQLAAATIALVGLIASFALIIDACATVPASATPTLRLTPVEESGRVAFEASCAHCHPGGAAGKGPSLRDKPLPNAVIRAQVRRGLGSMPAFPESALGDDELDAIITYLAALRAHHASARQAASDVPPEAPPGAPLDAPPAAARDDGAPRDAARGTSLDALRDATGEAVSPAP